jgi:hypothetical protein
LFGGEGVFGVAGEQRQFGKFGLAKSLHILSNSCCICGGSGGGGGVSHDEVVVEEGEAVSVGGDGVDRESF